LFFFSSNAHCIQQTCRTMSHLSTGFGSPGCTWRPIGFQPEYAHIMEFGSPVFLKKIYLVQTNVHKLWHEMASRKCMYLCSQMSYIWCAATKMHFCLILCHFRIEIDKWLWC
jgi:hypothetical protein